jgi:hypothetical protein
MLDYRDAGIYGDNNESFPKFKENLAVTKSKKP